MFYVDVDMVVPCLRSAQGHLSIQEPVRGELRAAGIVRTKVLQEHGPAGGNPVVRLYGSRNRLVAYLQAHQYGMYSIKSTDGLGSSYN